MILGLLATYLGIGLCLVFVGPASRSMRDDLEDENVLAGPKWKTAAYFTLLGLGVVFLWPVLVPSARNEERIIKAIRAKIPAYKHHAVVKFPACGCVQEWKRAPANAANSSDGRW